MQYIINTEGKKTAVIISFKEYEHFLQIQEDLEDVQAYDEAMAANDWVSLDEVKNDLGL